MYCHAYAPGHYRVPPHHRPEFYLGPGTFASPWKTISKAPGVAAAGDVINIRGNSGDFNERVTVNKRDGTAALPIVFQTYPGDPMVVLDLTGMVPPVGLSADFTITNSDYVTLRNLEIRNYKTAGTNDVQNAQTPIGIYIVGNRNGVAVHNCKVHAIWQSCTTLTDAGNAFGLAVYGNNATAVNNLVLDGNEIYNLRTGSSESVALNGNVTNFTVSNNIVHDCNNIGIDFIGFEDTNGDATLNQARLGTCANNVDTTSIPNLTRSMEEYLLHRALSDLDGASDLRIVGTIFKC